MTEQQKKNKNKLKGPVVRQFQWFQMETRVRKIIQQIVTPVQDQIVQNRFRFQDLKKKDTSFQSKIQYLLKMITNDPNIFKLGIFKSIQDKFQEQQKIITFLSQEVKNNTLYIQDKVKLIDQRMKESNNVIQQMSKMKLSNREVQETQTKQFNNIRLNIQKNLANMVHSIQDNQQYNRQKQQKLQKQLSKMKIDMEKISKQFQDVKLQTFKQKSFNEDLKQTQIKSDNLLTSVRQEVTNFSDRLKSVQKMKYFVNDMQNSFNKLQFKVDNILPLINQAQINECLYKIMPNKFHPRIAVYEFHKYMELNQMVLNRVFQTNSVKLNLNGEGMIRQSQERNTKLLTKLKRSYLIKQGHELDFIAYEQRERLLNDFNYQKLCEICQQMEQFQNQKADMKKKHNKLGEQQIREIVQQKFKNDKKQLLQKISIEISDSKKYIYQFQANIFKQIESVDTKCEQSNKKINEMLKQYSLKSKVDKQNAIKDRDDINFLKQQMLPIKQLTKSVYNFCCIANRLQIQREIHSEKKADRFNYCLDEKNKKRIHGNLVHQNSNSQSQSQKDSNLQKDSNFQQTDNHKMSMPQLLNLQTAALVEARQSYESLIKKPVSVTTAFQNRSQTNHSKRYSFSRNINKVQLFQLESDGNRIDVKLNKQKQISENPQKSLIFSQSGGFLKVPINKKDFVCKNNRICNTSRLDRNRASITPSKSCFMDENNKKSEVKQSMQFFSQLKKDNIKYLK